MQAKVLVVDDDPAIRELLNDWLASQRMTVFQASDGAQGFAMAERERPHLIIMDLVMPGLYGSSALKRLEQYGGTSKPQDDRRASADGRLGALSRAQPAASRSLPAAT